MTAGSPPARYTPNVATQDAKCPRVAESRTFVGRIALDLLPDGAPSPGRLGEAGCA